MPYCPDCGTSIPKGVDKCGECGWGQEDDDDEVVLAWVELKEC